MNTPGGDPFDLLVPARTVLLDVLEALAEHRHAVIVVGAQAIHLRTGGIDVALAESTKDSDIVLDPRSFGTDPTIEAVMRAAEFFPSCTGQPGSWVNAAGIPVDLMVPEQLAGPGNKQTRGARIPPHDNKATRRARGLEATLIDHSEMAVTALEPTDQRRITALVAGPAALLVAKCHKIAERVGQPHRLNDKDAHDVYRILRAVDTDTLRATITTLLADDLSHQATDDALTYLQQLFADSPTAPGATMAGRAEEGLGAPEEVAASVCILATDLLQSLHTPT
ncbi:hypothetical protein [Nocardia brasiliensis]|uniref:hypothetical protein n=1 Tax=Nocardia brasiliensis TaxID=37326 RepID=UPI002458F522|nr:hypothetical protein [Nocardia brasiliensis]